MLFKNGNLINSDFTLTKCDTETEGEKNQKLRTVKLYLKYTSL